MRRFFRSAAFPILIVIVLAFFAQRLISPNKTEEAPTFTEFQSQVDNRPDEIESVTFEQKNQTLTVAEQDGNEYSVGYLPENEQVLLNTLERQGSRPTSRAPAARASSRSSPTSSRSSSSSVSGSS